MLVPCAMCSTQDTESSPHNIYSVEGQGWCVPYVACAVSPEGYRPDPTAPWPDPAMCHVFDTPAIANVSFCLTWMSFQWHLQFRLSCLFCLIYGVVGLEFWSKKCMKSKGLPLLPVSFIGPTVYLGDTLDKLLGTGCPSLPGLEGTLCLKNWTIHLV